MEEQSQRTNRRLAPIVRCNILPNPTAGQHALFRAILNKYVYVFGAHDYKYVMSRSLDAQML